MGPTPITSSKEKPREIGAFSCISGVFAGFSVHRMKAAFHKLKAAFRILIVIFAHGFAHGLLVEGPHTLHVIVYVLLGQVGVYLMHHVRR